MASGRLFLPGWMPARDSDGDPIPNVSVSFYENETDDLASVYADDALTIPLTNPVAANSSGRFPQIYASDAITYSASVDAPYGPAGQPFTFDGLQASQAADIAAANLAQGAAEDAEVALQSTLDAIESATQAGGGSAAVAGALAGTTAANLVVANKANVNGDNISNPLAFRVAIDANYVTKNTDLADPQRNYSQVTVPYLGDNAWIDNAFAVQNNSVGDLGFGLVRGNAAYTFKDSLGVERGAMGYSRNSAHAPNNGFYPNIVYTEIGNPFTTDAQASSYRLIVTHKAGGPYWGGAAISYFPISVNSTNGDMRFSTNGGIGGGAITFDDATYFGDIGAVEIVGFGMSSTRARLRERGAADYFTLTTNISDPQLGSAPSPDDVTKSMWELGIGAGRDHFSVERYPAGTGQSPVNVFRAQLNAFMVGQTATSAGADGRLTVTSNSVAKTALTAKSDQGAAFPTAIIYNNAASGDSVLVAWGVNATYAQAGTIDYNRGANQIRYNVTSDERSKVEEGDVDPQEALERILSVRIIQARMNGATESINTVLAHELQEVFPAAVSGRRGEVDEAGKPVMQQVDFSKLIPDLVAAVQALAKK